MEGNLKKKIISEGKKEKAMFAQCVICDIMPSAKYTQHYNALGSLIRVPTVLKENCQKLGWPRYVYFLLIL